MTSKPIYFNFFSEFNNELSGIETHHENYALKALTHEEILAEHRGSKEHHVEQRRVEHHVQPEIRQEARREVHYEQKEERHPVQIE